jgi:hypothetical protein
LDARGTGVSLGIQNHSGGISQYIAIFTKIELTLLIKLLDQNLTKKIKKDQIRLICKYCISNKKRDAVVASPLQEIDLLQ